MNGQKIFWSWQDDDLTFDLSRANIGIFDSGLYRGFDPDIFNDGLTLTLEHITSGAFRTNKDRTLSDAFGVVVTKQGVIVQQDTRVDLLIQPSTFARFDLIVMEHEYKEITGGISAEYKVIQGDGTGIPSMTNPNLQVVLGYLYLPANTINLSAAGVYYVKAKKPTFANNSDFIEKRDGFFLTDLDARSHNVVNLGDPINGKDAVNKDFLLQEIANSVKFATETVRGVIELADASEALAGLDDLRAMTPFKTAQVILNKTASQLEVNAGVEGSKFVTPKTLSGRTATTSRTGIAKLADDTAAEDPTNNVDVITPYQLHRIAGLTQKIVELGEWDLGTNDTVTLAHTFPWWNKVIGSVTMIVGDDQTRQQMRFDQVSIDATTITVTKETGQYTGGNYDSVGFNRGWVVFLVKNDLVAPPSIISVNAGVDQTGSFRLLSASTPVLNSVEVIANTGTYPSSLPKLRANVTLFMNPVGTMAMYGQRKNPSGSSTWNNWVKFGDSQNSPEGFLTDTGADAYMDGDYYVKVVYTVFGVEYTSNVVEINLRDSGSVVGTSWAAVGSPQTSETNTTWSLTGVAESLGSSLTDITWSVVSAPAGATTTFGDVDSLATTFFGSEFGVYVLKLSGTNANGQTAEDTMTITITQILNVAPTSSIRWSDNTTGSKNIAWQVYNAYTGSWNGYYHANFNAAPSVDPDGYVSGYYWQFNYANNGWQDLDANAANFPNTVTVNKMIQGDGTWKFRCKVKDNLGEISAWSNELEMSITGSETTVVPLDVFQLQIMTGGQGEFNTQAQLSISPIANMSKLLMRIDPISGGGSTSTDLWYKVIGAGSLTGFLPSDTLATVDLTSIVKSSMSIFVDIRETPPYKYLTATFIAYDAVDNIIGSQQFSMGHL